MDSYSARRGEILTLSIDFVYPELRPASVKCTRVQVSEGILSAWTDFFRDGTVRGSTTRHEGSWPIRGIRQYKMIEKH